MPHLATRAALGACTASTAFAGLAAAAQAQTVKGTVVHRNARAHSFVVADHAGHLYAVHARRAPRLGSQVVVHAQRLHNGTFALQGEHVIGRARRVRVHGVVSWADARAGEFTVSSPGVSMLVRVHHHGRHAIYHDRYAMAADAGVPQVGTDVTATGTLDDQGDLEAQRVHDTGQDTDGITLEGTVLSVDTRAGTITVSADDDDQSGHAITVTVPSTFDISQFTTGEEVKLNVAPQANGTTTLLGSSDDENAQSADDQGEEQGDQGDDDTNTQRGSDETSARSGSSSGPSGD